jgi:hypothetical protein
VYIVVQRTPSAEAVRPTRNAISPRFAIKTEVMGVDCGIGMAELWSARWREARKARASAREEEGGRIGITLKLLKLLKLLSTFGASVPFKRQLTPL